ncbi:MAG: hypothetical protein SFY70_10455 [Bacteroidia bacterium]|nr:hypothetical protein [Bacteroidia bacterium]
MEPHLSSNGELLFFNNSNHPDSNTQLLFARRTSTLTFQFAGEVVGANTTSLEGTPSIDENERLYFISTRSYFTTLATVYSAAFSEGTATDVNLVDGTSRMILGELQFDFAISFDGTVGVVSDGLFTGNPFPAASDLAWLKRTGTAFLRTETDQALLQALNTDALEYAACLSADGLELYFTRYTEADGFGIFRSERVSTNANFLTPRRVSGIEGLVEAPCLSADGKQLYFHREAGGLYQLWVCTRQ